MVIDPPVKNVKSICLIPLLLPINVWSKDEKVNWLFSCIEAKLHCLSEVQIEEKEL